MSTTTDLSTLKINYLTQAQYDEALEDGDINQNELYFTPDTGQDGSKNVWYGTCSTGSNTNQKVATTTSGDFTLTTGNIVSITFSNANGVSASLNVDSTGDVPIRMTSGSSVNALYWTVGETVTFVYNGTYYLAVGKGTATTTYYGVTKLSTSTSSTSDTIAATPSAVKSAYDLANGKQDALVSGTNIKTINNNSLLGSGDITISGGSKNVWYGYCNTAGSTAEKVVTTISGDFELVDGNIIIVSFTNPVAGSPYLNVDGTGAVVVNYNDDSERVYQWYSTIAFAYDENAESFMPINRRRANGNYFGLVTGNEIPHDISQVSITVANWNATTTCTKSVTGVTASNSIIVSPAPASIADYVSAGVYCSAQASGTLTFTASSTPTADLVVNVMIVG